jgi:hypothetical protein
METNVLVPALRSAHWRSSILLLSIFSLLSGCTPTIPHPGEPMIEQQSTAPNDLGRTQDDQRRTNGS